jgi:uncharacterized protein YkwD
VVEQVNYQRSLYGLPPYTADPTLMQIAHGRSADMAERHYFSHFDPGSGIELGRSQVLGAGFGRASENIFRSGGELSAVPAQAVAWFMTDPPHRDPILSNLYTAVGAGIARDGPYWNLTITFAN